MKQAASPSSNFEEAADAIVVGQAATLQKLLHADPELVHARSERAHRSTLLHYVSANGVEDSRQKTPGNIVQIAELLLDAGADVNAVSDAYGGRSTTLALAATSCHPENAGVQLPLLALLLKRGATLDSKGAGSDVNSCLANGRREAAEFLANHGAQLDLEGAAGVGRLDVVKHFFDQDGSLKPTATLTELQQGFAWACEYGRTAVVDFLLNKGIDVNAKFQPHGQTSLHWAAYGGHADLVQLLLAHQASVDPLDDNYGSTPLGWALYRWTGARSNEIGARSNEIEDRAYYETVALLTRAGAKLDPQWQIEQANTQGTAEKIRSDPRMQSALRGNV